MPPCRTPPAPVKARIPYVLCLHDDGQNGEKLLQSLHCASAVDAANVALLLPDGQNSCFLNMAHGPKWETYLLRGLLPFAERTFPLRAKPGLLGVGTGGWAAARLAAQAPERFAASVAADAWEDLARNVTRRGNLQAGRIWKRRSAIPKRCPRLS